MPISVADQTISDNYMNTYVASWSNFTIQANPLDIFSLTGSPTKLVRILRIGISGIETTGASTNMFVINNTNCTFSGGTPVAPTGVVSYDSNSPISTAVARVYTTNPTNNAPTSQTWGNIMMIIPSSTTINADQGEYIMDFTNYYGSTGVLRGTSEILSINMIVASLSGNVLNMWAEWTEE